MNQVRLLSQPSYGQMEFQVQLLQIHAGQIAHLHMLQVMPTSLVPRTQIRRISRQRLHVNPLGCSARQVFTNRTPTMNRRAIPDNEQAFPGVTPHMLQEHHGVLTRQRFWTNQRIHLPGRGKAGHDRQVIAAQPLVDHRRVAFRSVGFDHPRQQIETRFVHENQGPALPRRLTPQLWPDRHSPALNRPLVTLERSGNGNLGRPAQFLHQAGNVVLVIGDTKLPLNHLGDSSTGPNVPTKTISFSSVPQKLRQPSHLGRRQFPGRTSGGMAMQRLWSCRGRHRQPPADRPFADANCCRNIDFQPAHLMQLERLEPSPFSHTPIKRWMFHLLMLTKVALFAQLSVVCASKRFEGGLTGNSFWLWSSEKAGDWYVATWTPRYYLIPATTDVVALCVS